MKKFLIIYFLICTSSSLAQQTLTSFYPRYNDIVYKFFTSYSLKGIEYYYLNFVKNKEGYSVRLDQYDASIKRLKTIENYPIWSAKERKYVDAGLPAAQENENANLLKSYIENYVVAAHYDCDPYYGYPSSFKDVINDFRDYTDKNDSLLYGLSNAYFEYARHYLTLNTFYELKNYADTTNMSFPVDRNRYIKLMDTALYYDSLLIKKNPLFVTSVSSAQNHYANDCICAWLDLSIFGYDSDANKYIHSNQYDPVFISIAKNYLMSCAPDAILFTNGDNDTYPLIYVQQALHYRPDVTIVNISLLGLADYITYINKFVPIDIPTDIYANDKLDMAYYQKAYGDSVYSLSEWANSIKSQAANDSTKWIIYHAKSLYLNTNYPALSKDVSINKWLRNLVKDTMYWTLESSRLDLSHIIILQIINNNDWRRPVEYALSCDLDYFMGLETHFVQEGLVYRIFPKDFSSLDSQPGALNPSVNYELLKNRFEWGGVDKTTGITEFNEQITLANMLAIFDRTIELYIHEKQNDTAYSLLEKAMTVIPFEHLKFGIQYPLMVKHYFQLNKSKEAKLLAHSIINYNVQKLNGYINSTVSFIMANQNIIGESMQCLEELKENADEFKDKTLANELSTDLTKYNHLVYSQ